VTYGLVVAACLWGKRSAQDGAIGQPPKRVSRPLCAAALAWIAAILLLLVYMTAMSMSHHALVITSGVLAIIGGSALTYVVARRLAPRAKLRPDPAE